ncbi:MAG: lipopolysaccharide assembly protein LapA domain-containing protein [Beijerinckiaceae bacterium]
MRTLFRLFVLVPIAVLLLLFAFANRHLVTVSFDPFAGNDISGPAVTAPLFILLILAIGLGVILGGASSWLRQAQLRRAVRDARAEASEARADAARLRSEMLLHPPVVTPGPGTSVALPMRRDAA